MGKTDYFKYFLNKLYDYGGINNDFGKQKSQMLFFFLLNLVDNRVLYETFNEFYCLPYGPIDKSFNSFLKGYELCGRFCLIGKSQINIVDEITEHMDKAFVMLVNSGLTEKRLSYLTDLSFEHSSWINARREAIKNQKLSWPITKTELINEMKFFSL